MKGLCVVNEVRRWYNGRDNERRRDILWAKPKGSQLYSEFGSKGIRGRLVNPVEGSLMVPPGVSLWALS